MPAKKKTVPEPKKIMPAADILQWVKTWLSKPSNLVLAALFIFLMFIAWKVTATSNEVEEIKGAQAEMFMEPLATQGRAPTIKATFTPYRPDPNKTPIDLNFDPFIYTGFQISARGGTLRECPSRTLSVRDKPSISGNVVGCLPAYGVWNVEQPYKYEGNNVWGLLAMQADKWIPLKYGNTYTTNWRDK